MTGQKEPKATRDSDFPGTLNGAGSEKNLAQRGFDAAVDEQSGTFVGLLSTRFGGLSQIFLPWKEKTVFLFEIGFDMFFIMFHVKHAFVFLICFT